MAPSIHQSVSSCRADARADGRVLRARLGYTHVLTAESYSPRPQERKREQYMCVALPSPAGTWARLAPTRCEGSLRPGVKAPL